jgi:hypothetical protein
MSIKTAYSTKSAVKDAAAEVAAGIKESRPSVVVLFSSSKYEPAVISAELQAAFKNALVIGCSTAGEIVSGKMLKNSVVAMGIGADVVEDASVEVVNSIKAENHVPEAFTSFEKHFGVKMVDMDTNNYVGLILVDGLQGAEEGLMEKIGDLTNITFIGGSAGDDLAFKQTFVYANGKSFSNAAVLAVLKLKKGFDIIKTQSFCTMNKKLKATKVDERNRTVLEFNGKPAVAAYAEALGVDPKEGKNQFMRHPLGLIASDGQPFVRSPQQIKDNAMVFYCNIKEASELSVLESTDIINDTRKSVEEKMKSLGPVSGMINFHCILRTLELDEKNQSAAYGKLFSSVPTIGFSTYGEEYVGHINQTSTILVFK